MDIIQKTLLKCGLFAQLSTAQIKEIVHSARLTVRSFERGAVVAIEEDSCNAIGIVALGSIHIQRIFPNGKLITIETFTAGDSFGEALIFSDRSTYPATLVAHEDVTVVFVPREYVVTLCSQYPAFLAAFLRALSNRILLLNQKIKNLSLGTIRQKVANYLLEERRRQGRDVLTLTFNRGGLADWLGLPRPSVSRELIFMKDAGWIDFDRRTVSILDSSALEEALHR